MKLQRNVVVGIRMDCKRDCRVLEALIEQLGCGIELTLVHVVVLPAGYLSVADSQKNLVHQRVKHHIAPFLRERHIPFSVRIVHASSSVFLAQPHSAYISRALLAQATITNAAALAVGGSGQQNPVRAVLLGSRVSNYLQRLSQIPLVLVGRHGLTSSLPPEPSVVEQLCGAGVVAAAA